MVKEKVEVLTEKSEVFVTIEVNNEPDLGSRFMGLGEVFVTIVVNNEQGDSSNDLTEFEDLKSSNDLTEYEAFKSSNDKTKLKVLNKVRTEDEALKSSDLAWWQEATGAKSLEEFTLWGRFLIKLINLVNYMKVTISLIKQL